MLAVLAARAVLAGEPDLTVPKAVLAGASIEKRCCVYSSVLVLVLVCIFGLVLVCIGLYWSRIGECIRVSIGTE